MRLNSLRQIFPWRVENSSRVQRHATIGPAPVFLNNQRDFARAGIVIDLQTNLFQSCFAPPLNPFQGTELSGSTNEFDFRTDDFYFCTDIGRQIDTLEMGIIFVIRLKNIRVDVSSRSRIGFAF